MTATLPAELKSLMTLTFTVESKSGNDGYKDTYGAPRSYQCYADETPTMVRDMQGAQVVASATFYVASDDLLVTDRFTFKGQVRDTLKVATYYDENGATYAQVVYVG